MIDAKVIADSVGPKGQRVTTMEVTIHRFVLAEITRHRMFSFSVGSSRAIPVKKQLDEVYDNPAWPIEWGSEKPGMQGGDELTGEDLREAQALFERVNAYTVNQLYQYLEAHPLDQEGSVRLHKSLLNRLIEPFMWTTLIITGTEWDNFFALRCHPLAQPELREVAYDMRIVYEASKPKEIDYLDWHIPYTTEEDGSFKERLVMSVARCAWVSTASHDGDHSFEACQRMYDRLKDANPMHASPFEHQCWPVGGLNVPQIGNLLGFRQLRHVVERETQLIKE